MNLRRVAWFVAVIIVWTGGARAQAPDYLTQHPAAETLRRVLKDAQLAAGFRPTGLGKQDYLPLIAGNIDFFKQHQDGRGAIIDPYEKKERQYSTPAFALAAALLVAESKREDLLDPASRALSFSITALVNNTTADNHPDFYIPMVVHARRLLAARVKPDVADSWTNDLKVLIPEMTYRDTTPRGNWNVVNIAGELLRRKDGLVPPDHLAAHQTYIDRCLEAQQKHMTKFGMYEDPNAPLAYDAFPRLWLEDVLADGAYDGKHHKQLEQFLTLGGLSTLLLLSPTGEWASGGRSAHHQWNEAEVAVVCEINANRWKRWGRPDIAGAFKRAARLALSSMRRWQRPSGEMWIVKNRADPPRRHGYEGYSFHSQYNLLPMAMLAIAYQRADDTIAERPIPAEHANYVFDLRDTFHKVVAAAGGTYVLIDTGADPHYNATGLQRVHKAGVAYSPFSDTAAALRSYGPASERIKLAISPSITWKDAGSNEDWLSLSHFTVKQRPYARVVRIADLKVDEQRDEEAVAFRLRYLLEGRGSRLVEEQYRIDSSGVEVRSHVGGDDAPAAARVIFPVLVSDGATKTDVMLEGPRLTVRHHGSRLTFEVIAPEPVKLQLTPPDVVTHNGFVRMVTGDLPPVSQEARWKISLVEEQAAR
jgi:hypothetical protein